jgi:uncharacterized repeat protein (TIGR03803 family)
LPYPTHPTGAHQHGKSKPSRLLIAVAATPALFAAPACAKPVFQVLYAFDGATHGANPNQLLGYQSNEGDPTSWALYGTTSAGGTNEGTICGPLGGCGLMYKLAPKAAGTKSWAETVLHVFAGGTDGDSPYAGLTVDGTGALYGTTGYGGTATGDSNGTVFRLTPPAAGARVWTQTVLASFDLKSKGAVPVAGVTLGSGGVLYGTTYKGGKSDYGTVFQLTPPAAGKTAWKETVLHNFTGDTVEGGYPQAPVLLDSSGALYGTVNFNAGWGNGAAFELTPPASGSTTWTNNVLHSFDGPDGVYPSSALVADETGALYGTTKIGGSHGWGEVIKLTPPVAGSTSWTETVLYSFTNGRDGGTVINPLLRSASGALYGTAVTGGNPNCAHGAGCGVVFKLTPPKKGLAAWTERTLHAFSGGNDGAMCTGQPAAGLVADPNGALYGTAFSGGHHGAGVVFRITE